MILKRKRSQAPQGELHIEHSSEGKQLYVDTLQSLDPLHTNHESPYAFLNESILKVDRFAPDIPFREPVEDAIVAIRLALWAAMRDGRDALGRERGKVEAQARLRKAVEWLRLELDSFDRPELLSQLLQAERASYRIQKDRVSDKGPALSPEPMHILLTALSGMRAWLDAAEDLAKRGPGTFSRNQARAFVRSLALWWERNVGSLPPKTRKVRKPGVEDRTPVHFFDLLDGAQEDAGIRGPALKGMVRGVIEEIEASRRGS